MEINIKVNGKDVSIDIDSPGKWAGLIWASVTQGNYGFYEFFPIHRYLGGSIIDTPMGVYNTDMIRWKKFSTWANSCPFPEKVEVDEGMLYETPGFVPAHMAELLVPTAERERVKDDIRRALGS
jgi:hypothetical protein